MPNLKKTAPSQMYGAAKEEAVDQGIIVQTRDLDYLEQTVKRMVAELKARGCLSEGVTFLTRAEQEAALEEHIDRFLKSP